MLHIDFSARLTAKEGISLDQLNADIRTLCAKYGKTTRAAVESYYSDGEELKRLTETEAETIRPLTNEEFDKLNSDLAKGLVPSINGASAPVVKEEPKDEIDLPEFPVKDEVTKEDLRSLLRAVKEHSTQDLGLRDVYAKAGKEGKTFSALAAEEYKVMYQEGRKILWQLMRS